MSGVLGVLLGSERRWVQRAKPRKDKTMSDQTKRTCGECASFRAADPAAAGSSCPKGCCLKTDAACDDFTPADAPAAEPARLTVFRFSGESHQSEPVPQPHPALPDGTYRVVCGELVRIVPGVPPELGLPDVESVHPAPVDTADTCVVFARPDATPSGLTCPYCNGLQSTKDDWMYDHEPDCDLLLRMGTPSALPAAEPDATPDHHEYCSRGVGPRRDCHVCRGFDAMPDAEPDATQDGIPGEGPEPGFAMPLRTGTGRSQWTELLSDDRAPNNGLLVIGDVRPRAAAAIVHRVNNYPALHAHAVKLEAEATDLQRIITVWRKRHDEDHDRADRAEAERDDMKRRLCAETALRLQGGAVPHATPHSVAHGQFGLVEADRLFPRQAQEGGE